METILLTFGKLILLYFGLRGALWVVSIFIRISRGGGLGSFAFLPAVMMADLSRDWGFAGTQIVEDIFASLPAVLGIAALVFGVRVIWNVFVGVLGLRPGSRRTVMFDYGHGEKGKNVEVRGKDGRWHLDRKATHAANGVAYNRRRRTRNR